jgi:hypothetical protein
MVLPVSAPLLALAIGTVATVVTSHVAETSARRRVARENELLEARVRERTAELRQTQLEIVQRLSQAVEWRDEETGAHIDRIGQLSERVALAIGMAAAEAETIRHASAAHDFGKIGIPDRILLKPGRLTPEERREMERHAAMGGNLLSGSSSELLRLAETIARTHHERWDGTGYPEGLAGEDIPLPGRICAVCDVFDALVSERPYKEAWTVEAALAEITGQSGRHFDPALVDVFVPVARAAYADLYAGQATRATLPLVTRTRSSGVMQKTSWGVPAAAQTTENCSRSSSTKTSSGRPCPTGGTPPIEKPVAVRTSSAPARSMASPTSTPTRASSTRLAPEVSTSSALRPSPPPLARTNTSDLTI